MLARRLGLSNVGPVSASIKEPFCFILLVNCWDGWPPESYVPQWWSGQLRLGAMAAILSCAPLPFMIRHVSCWELSWGSGHSSWLPFSIAAPFSSDLCWTAKLTLCHFSKGLLAVSVLFDFVHQDCFLEAPDCLWLPDSAVQCNPCPCGIAAQARLARGILWLEQSTSNCWILPCICIDVGMWKPRSVSYFLFLLLTILIFLLLVLLVFFFTSFSIINKAVFVVFMKE